MTTRYEGFVLPIVVLVISIMGLALGGLQLPTVDDRERLQQRELVAELLFWHKALVSYAFHQDSGVSNFNELLTFYSLDKPEVRLLNGEIVTFSGIPTFDSTIDLRITNLPTEIVAHYQQMYPLGISVDRTGGLILAPKAIDDWGFTQSLLRRKAVARAELETDVDLNRRHLNSVNGLYTEVLSAQHAEFNELSYVTDSLATVSTIESLKLSTARVGSVDVKVLVEQIVLLEEQLGPCLEAMGPCHN
ncbi:hypothetical protein [Pseudidiomarina sp.]|uniref:hypothetical protein n=1 Tax=Pseudidiomarina sp. TaxID=2081707 RepID=UPI003A96CC47